MARGDESGQACDSLVSTIDLAPTILKAAGVDVPDTMQGVDMRPMLERPAATIRQYAFSEHNWNDYEAHGRSLRTADGWLYVRNARPKLAWQGPADSVRSDSHQQLRQLREAGRLNPVQADVFLVPRPVEELYRTSDDPHQVNNLAQDPAYSEQRQRLSGLLDRWMDETADSVPDQISGDSFDRKTGKPLGGKGFSYRRTTPGEDRGATHSHRPGPR